MVKNSWIFFPKAPTIPGFILLTENMTFANSTFIKWPPHTLILYTSFKNFKIIFNFFFF